MRKRRTRQEWQALLDEQQHSGLSIQRFFQSEGITPSSFYSWRTKLRRGESSALDLLGAVESMAVRYKRDHSVSEQRVRGLCRRCFGHCRFNGGQGGISPASVSTTSAPAGFGHSSEP